MFISRQWKLLTKIITNWPFSHALSSSSSNKVSTHAALCTALDWVLMDVIVCLSILALLELTHICRHMTSDKCLRHMSLGKSLIRQKVIYIYTDIIISLKGHAAPSLCTFPVLIFIFYLHGIFMIIFNCSDLQPSLCPLHVCLIFKFYLSGILIIIFNTQTFDSHICLIFIYLFNSNFEFNIIYFPYILKCQ